MDKQRMRIMVNINGKPRPFTVERSSEGRPSEESDGYPVDSHLGKGQRAENEADDSRQVSAFQEGGPSAGKPSTGLWFTEDGQVREDVETTGWEEAAALEADERVISEAMQQKKSGRRRPWRLPAQAKSLLAAALVAALVGMAFGMTVLHIIPKEKSASSPASEAMTELTKPETAAGGEGRESVIRAPFSIAVIQAGVYSNAAAAKQASESIKTAGVPVVVAGQKPAALYIAVGADKETLRAVNDQYRQRVPSTYVKELSFAAEAAARRSDIVQKGEALYGSMAAVSAALLAGKDVSDGEWKALSKVYGSFEKSETPNDNTVKKYAESLKQAYLALVAYKEGEEKELLNKTQQQLLEALAVYMELVPLRS
ncbi:stage II sporulation protein D [Geobacillus stearothermophilus]|uniref:stage II sporulation protein D n=1 Tax=Geobacillus stearothermophilus TaxID=1422 RepID=UPI002E1B66DC|nr:stage II sporulation protein D [Geobacillus stearothermophilus]MED4986016.1 stage II sporulation protein D [Geobacillus stearothermophilus]